MNKGASASSCDETSLLLLRVPGEQGRRAMLIPGHGVRSSLAEVGCGSGLAWKPGSSGLLSPALSSSAVACPDGARCSGQVRVPVSTCNTQ